MQGAQIGLYDMVLSTTLESNKSQKEYREVWRVDRFYDVLRAFWVLFSQRYD